MIIRNTEGYHGEHATSVNNNGLPTIEDMCAVGETVRIPHKKGREIILSMMDRCSEILSERFK